MDEQVNGNDENYKEYVNINRYSRTDGCSKVNDLLGGHSVEHYLQQESTKHRQADEPISWYHGKITREVSEQIIQEEVKKSELHDGIFLVRERILPASESRQNVVLSLTHEGKILHFQMQEKWPGYYIIENDPVIQGLESSIHHYRSKSPSDHGLPTRLVKFCKGMPPPSHTRCKGHTNLLHLVVLEGNHQLVEEILNAKSCPDIDAKDNEGYTAFHHACFCGHNQIIHLLLKHGANPNGRDIAGYTALQRACADNKLSIVQDLLEKGHCDPQECCPRTGWFPLHEATQRGHRECIRMLLSHFAPMMPRTNNGETPLDLVTANNLQDCLLDLKNHQSPVAITSQSQWFHDQLDRKGAKKLLEDYGQVEGLFLIRSSSKHHGWFVLSLSHTQADFHYEIRSHHYRDSMVLCIDNGPFLESLEQLVHHYSIRKDGLPCILRLSVSPAGDMHPVPKDERYNLIHPTNLAGATKPAVPPRPVSLEDPSASKQHSNPSSPKGTRSNKHSPPLTATKHALSNDQTGAGLPARIHKIVLHIPAASSKPESLPTSTSSSPSTTCRPPISPRNLLSPNKLLSPVNRHPPADKGSVTTPPPLPSHPPPLSLRPPSPPDKPEELTILSGDQIKLGSVLGEGEYGMVRRGVLTIRKDRKHKEKKDVAVKLWNKMSGKVEDFLKEATVMQNLHHACIVELIGVCKDPVMLVEEYVPMGAMLDYLIDNAQQISVNPDLYIWADQICLGMIYMEQKKLVHRDLAARNILLMSKSQIKISDFGLSRAVGRESDYYEATKGGRWPVKWYAPECVYFGKFSNASDVWSFGVTLWEMFSMGDPPYGDLNGPQVIKSLEDNQRLTRPEICPVWVYNVMLKCWSFKAAERPTFEALKRLFDQDSEYESVCMLHMKKQKSRKPSK